MLLDRIDIDAHGPLTRVEIGPLAEHLNVVCGPEGSGKTAIARFIRDSLVHRRYPLGMLSSSTGRVVWADRNGMIHCRREQDGTAEGRRTIEFESRGDHSDHLHALKHSWIHAVNDSSLASRAAISIQIPESIVDCVITDTAVTNVARVVSACVRNGLDSYDTYRSLPLAEDRSYLDRDESIHGRSMEVQKSGHDRALRAELADIDAELARIGSQGDMQTLIARRDELNSRLNRRPEGFVRHASVDDDRRRKIDVYVERAETLRRRQNELRRWIAELDAELSRVRSSHHTPYHLGDRSYSDYRETVYRSHAHHVDETLRRRLDDLDTQVIRWRRMLMEVRGLRDTIFRENDQHAFGGPFGRRSIESIATRRRRLDGFLNMIDRYDRDRPLRDGSWKRYHNDETFSHRIVDDIESRIDAATRQIDWLLERYRDGGLYFDWYQTAPLATTYRATTTLSETLQAIRHDLLQVAASTRRQHFHHQQIQGELAAEVVRSQGDRCSHAVSELNELHQSEQWLVAAIDQLSRHRESVLRDLASNRSSAPETPNPVTHPAVGWDIHLWDAAGYAKERAQRASELAHVTAQLNTCLDQVADLRRVIHRDGRGGSATDFRCATEYATYDTNLHGDSLRADWIDDEAILNELRYIDESLAIHSRAQALRLRRSEILNQLQVVRHAPRTHSPLAEDASRWLVRLSAGRLRRIEWNLSAMRDDGDDRRRCSLHHEDASGAPLYRSSSVRLDGVEEANCPAADRALAALAVRLAAGDLLARTGRLVPLVIETWRELLVDTASPYSERTLSSNPYSLRGFDHQFQDAPLAFYRYGDEQNSNHPIATALYDYSRSGRQVVVLTSDVSLADQIDRVGGRRFDLVGQHAVHPHRPLWKSHYATESYVGPHPHVSGTETGTHRTSTASYPNHAGDVNRSLDEAWRETYGIHDHHDLFVDRSPTASMSSVRTDWAIDGVDYRDGYYYADTYTTLPRDRRSPSRRPVAHPVRDVIDVVTKDQAFKKPESPFFLSVDSPIDQAPSIDAIAAARLRGLSVSHVNHLMQQDPNRLADALGLANVDAAVVRRWQSECRLVCRVPQLRGFDARILVGCGVTDPAQLAAIPPIDLLDRVKRFLATEQGQRILLSGSSYELSRITSWIAAANSSTGINGRANSERVGFRKYAAGVASQTRDDFDSDRYEYESKVAGDEAYRHRVRRNRIRTAGKIDPNLSEIDAYETAYSMRDGVSYRDRSSRGVGNREARQIVDEAIDVRERHDDREVVRSPQERTASAYRDLDDDGVTTGKSRGDDDLSPKRENRSERSSLGERERRRSRKTRSQRNSGLASDRDHGRSSTTRSERTAQFQSRGNESALRFYLQRDSDVVDAPSIGARMAEHLNAVGIHTVNDLLHADAEQLAVELDDRRIDSQMIVSWQQQAALVCRVPMLRGHDAQLLVAADVTTPEELVTYSPDDLFALIDPISHSSEGKRILRGGNLPDLKEITEWLHYAQYHRELVAA